MKTPVLAATAALVVGAAGGYLVGNSFKSAPAPQTTASEAGNTKSGRAGASGSRGSSRPDSLESIYREPGQVARMQSLMDYYAKLDPAAFEKEAKNLELLPMHERIMAGTMLFARWAEVAPQEAMAFTETMGMGGMFAKPTILQSWASSDPENAADYYLKNKAQFDMMGGFGGGGPGGRGGNAASIIASEWARQDPTAALAWVKGLEGNQSGAMASVIRQVAQNDPTKAAELVAQLPAEAQGRSYEAIAQQWASKDWSATEQWIRSLPADQQADATEAAVRGLAATDPKLAAEKVSALANGESKADAMQTVAENWSRQSPADAASWVMQNGDAEAQREAIGSVVMNWARQDDAAALAFVKNQQAGEVRDQAVQSYVFGNRSTDQAGVFQLAETISDENERSRVVGMAAARWMRTDEAAAKQAIQSSTVLSDQAKQRLSEGRGGWGGGRGNRGNRGGGR